MKFFAATVALVTAAVANAQVNFTNCATTSDLNVTSMTLNPYPICLGKSVCATVVGTLSTPIISPSTLRIIGTVFDYMVYNEHFDLCTLVSCPVAQSTTTLEFCIPMPILTDIWPFNFTFSAVNGNGNILMCQTGTVNFKNC